MKRIQPEDVCEAEWAEWYRLTPLQRWQESQKLRPPTESALDVGQRPESHPQVLADAK